MTISSEAAKLGFRGYDLEARYARGEVEAAYGDRAAGRARLAALSKEAEQAGYLSLARRASDAATK